MYFEILSDIISYTARHGWHHLHAEEPTTKRIDGIRRDLLFQ
jgi:hypothetical protein